MVELYLLTIKMDITPYLGSIITIVLAVVGVYAAFSTRITKLETLIEVMQKTLNENSEQNARIYKIESDLKTVWLRIDSLKESIQELQGKKKESDK